ncbi:MAG: choline/ethanolamine kinase family protein [Pseudomonadota bacterium]
MAIKLPSTSRLKLDQTLSQWRSWNTDSPLVSKPEAVKLLGNGISNYSVLVRADDYFVVRIDGLSPASYGLNRQTEWQTLRVAHGSGIAPKPCYLNPELGSLVTAFLPPDRAQPHKLEEVAQLLRRIHQLPSRHHRLDLRERINKYQRQLEKNDRGLLGNYSKVASVIDALLDETSRHNDPLVLCHNDLLRPNRIYSQGRIFALDWEYSAMCTAYYDLAVVAAGDDLSTEQTQQLLQAYWSASASTSHLERLKQYICIYRFLECLWYALLDRSSGSSAFSLQRVEKLERDLESL